MKAKLSLLLTLLLLFSSFSVQAATSRSAGIQAELSFDKQTAICKAIVDVDNDDEISITIKLWEGTRCIKTWTSSGTGYLSFSKTAAATTGKTYKLTVDVKINGVAQATKTDVGICGY